MRHGDAVDSRTAPEPLRHLTPLGRDQVRKVASELRRRGYALTHAYASPLVRAVQSAELLCAELRFAGPIPVHPHLVPEGTTARALSVLDLHADQDFVALVTHEPIVRAMASHLTGSAIPSFTTAGVAIVELPAGALLDQLTP